MNENGTRTIGTSHKLNILIEGADIIRFVKSQRIELLGHVVNIDDRPLTKYWHGNQLVRDLEGGLEKNDGDYVEEDL